MSSCARHHRVGTGLTKDERRLVNDHIKDLLQEQRPQERQLPPRPRCHLHCSRVFGYGSFVGIVIMCVAGIRIGMPGRASMVNAVMGSGPCDRLTAVISRHLLSCPPFCALLPAVLLSGSTAESATVHPADCSYVSVP